MAALGLLLVISISQNACTRDEVAAAISTLAVDLEATLQPWGATTIANAHSVATQVPSIIATSKASTPGELPTENQNRAELNPIAEMTQALAQITPTVTRSTTPTATSTHTPTAAPTVTSVPTATLPPTATPTPYPAEIEVLGGSMLRITGGVFQMGAPAASLADECSAFRDVCQNEWFSASEPVHSVLLRSYYIDVHEVTNASYAAFLDENGNSCLEELCVDLQQSELTQQGETFTVDESQSQHPATGVTWYGAQAFCDWRGGRLPTEAEWEKAAAWDREAEESRPYPWGDVFDGRLLNSCDASCDEPQANAAFDDGYPMTAPVASYPNGRSAFGLYDMAGNVWEWVGDWYDPGHYQSSVEANPTGPKEGNDKVVRGGSWFDTGNFAGTTIRFPSPPLNADETIGFRCAADLGN